MGLLEALLLTLAGNTIIKLVVLAVVMDTVFGVCRAIKERCFNSCVGIDGAVRKVSMLVSVVFLAIVDRMVHINLIGFIPEAARAYFPESINTIGIAEFFGILYICYEIVSILKNMTLCGLPVKKLWQAVQAFLGKYTTELPDTAEKDAEDLKAATTAVILTDNVPEGATEDNPDGSAKVYNESGEEVGSISKEAAEAAATIK